MTRSRIPNYDDQRRERRREEDRRRYAANPWRKVYSTKEWKAARKAQLERMPWCERCWPKDVLTAASVVNHRKKHGGDPVLFFDPGNHESLCQPCHDRDVQREEQAPLHATEEDARRAYVQRRANLLKSKGFLTSREGEGG